MLVMNMRIFVFLEKVILLHYIKVWHLSRSQATNVQASLRKCVDSPESSLLVYTKYGSRWRPGPKYGHLAALDTPLWALLARFCVYGVSA